MKKNESKGMFIFTIIAACILCLVQVYSLSRNKGSRDITVDFNGRGKVVNVIKKPYIAKVHIKGVIEEAGRTYNQSWLLKTIDTLKADPLNKAIILYIDSPGGSVYQADEAYLALLDYKKEKPVYAYFGPMAASGGYYIGCSASCIGANRNCLTGSIGVIFGDYWDFTQLLEGIGVKSRNIHSGRNKNMGNINEPFTPEQQKIMQAISDECYGQFTGIVAESRGIEIGKVKELADGRIYTASQAKDNGLIDMVCSFEEFAARIKDTDINLAEVTEITDYEYKMDRQFYEFFNSLVSSISSPKAILQYR